MAVIQVKNHLPARLAALGILSITAIVGGFGARNTMQGWDSSSSIRAERDAALKREVEAIKAEAQVAETYSELGYKQATCGTTLAKFVFDKGRDSAEQLTEWGFDWNAPSFNTDQWHPLFDGAGQIFGGIRVENGQQRLVTTIEAPNLNQASMCNQNTLVH